MYSHGIWGYKCFNSLAYFVVFYKLSLRRAEKEEPQWSTGNLFLPVCNTWVNATDQKDGGVLIQSLDSMSAGVTSRATLDCSNRARGAFL